MQDILSSQIQAKKIAHAYLFCGQNQDCLFAESQKFSQQLGIHLSEITICNKEEKVKISELRNIIKNIYLKPVLSKYKLIIVANADNLSIENSNILLKTLEECPDYVIIILLANKAKNILPTVLSRCQLIKFQEKVEINTESISALEKILDNNLFLKQKFDLLAEISENNFEKTINDWIIYFSKQEKNYQNQLIIEKLFKIKKISNSNMNKKLALENFVLSIN